jgi:hypothetical protein
MSPEMLYMVLVVGPTLGLALCEVSRRRRGGQE